MVSVLGGFLISFLSFSFQYSTKLFLLVNPLLSGDRNHSTETVERQLERTSGILSIDVRLSSILSIIARTHTLYNRTILIRNLPDFLLDDTRKTTNETVDRNTLFHHSLSLSLSLISTLYHADLEFSREI